MYADDARPFPDVQLLRRSLLDWYRREGRDLPWRRTRDPYAVWISEVMLQQTTVATVIPYYERFLIRFPDLASLAASDEEELLAHWAGLGYYRRARNLRAAARIIMEEHGGRFPREPAQILALPGIGRYTAGAIASNCFDLALPAVDTNAARVIARLYAVAGNEGHTAPSAPRHTPPDPRYGPPAGERENRERAIWQIAETLVPPESPGDWTQALMELGATICRPASPDCGICPVAGHCRAHRSGDLAPYSLARPRVEAVPVDASLVVVERGSGARRRILLVRRDAGELLGGMWELPGSLARALDASARKVGRRGLHSGDRSRDRGRVDAASAAPAARPAPARRESRAAVARAIEDQLGFEPAKLDRAAEVRHSVTHRRLRIAVWRARAPRTASLPGSLRGPRSAVHLWASPRTLSTLPIAAASNKALTALRSRPASEGARP